MSFEVLLHLGSLVAVLVYFRSRIITLVRCLFDKSMTRERKIVLFLIIGTLPAVFAGVLLKDFFERAFSNPLMTSFMLIATGGILLSTRFVRRGSNKIAMPTALIMGVGQAMAILPGISRSGTTIAAGMMSGVEPSEAAEFSFLLSVPAILGAVVFKSKDLLAIDSSLAIPYILGIVVTFVSSILAVYAVLAAIKRGKFVYFAYYCFAAGALGLYLFL